ncbi:hypothetical protein ACFVFS_08465 [Kitasatospora sp. NPDC057692]|uniref:hypothetical protein n=1 Tax=Kitasatospora sp. NPDC057692 TaxID=3346215 RepID=UPI003680D575
MSAPLQEFVPAPFPLLVPTLPPANPHGLRWLAGLHPDPASCLDAGAGGRLAGIPYGRVWALWVTATIGYRLLHVLAEHGPVLHTYSTGTVSFLTRPDRWVQVPPEVGELLTKGVLPCPAPGRALPVRRPAPSVVRRSPGGMEVAARARAADMVPYWMVEPDGSGGRWDAPALLAAVCDEYAFLWGLPDDERTDAGPVAVSAPDADAFARFHTAARRA